jgi:hypothetical protein
LKKFSFYAREINNAGGVDELSHLKYGKVIDPAMAV